MSATPDSTLADPQQIIADLQRKLNEAEAERDGALAQQTATAEVLGVINSSGGDLAPVFDIVLDKAMQLCGAAFGAMFIVEGDVFQTVAARGLPAACAVTRRRFSSGCKSRPATAPAGSSRSRHGGDEMSEAFG